MKVHKLKAEAVKTPSASRLVTVPLKSGQTVSIVPANPVNTDIRKPYFLKWVESCSKIPADHWRPARKNTKAKLSEPIPIASMHTMQLVNAIKWCIRSAAAVVSNSPFFYINTPLVTLLSMSPQWAYLLQEAKVRHLRIVGCEQIDFITGDVVGFAYSQWFEEAFKAITFKKLEE